MAVDFPACQRSKVAIRAIRALVSFLVADSSSPFIGTDRLIASLSRCPAEPSSCKTSVLPLKKLLNNAIFSSGVKLTEGNITGEKSAPYQRFPMRNTQCRVEEELISTLRSRQVMHYISRQACRISFAALPSRYAAISPQSKAIPKLRNVPARTYSVLLYPYP